MGAGSGTRRAAELRNWCWFGMTFTPFPFFFKTSTFSLYLAPLFFEAVAFAIILFAFLVVPSFTLPVAPIFILIAV
jgi:hypothetical protein